MGWVVVGFSLGTEGFLELGFECVEFFYVAVFRGDGKDEDSLRLKGSVAFVKQGCVVFDHLEALERRILSVFSAGMGSFCASPFM